MASKNSRVIKEGFLVKSPPQDKLMASWHKRFFVLWSTGLIEYYSSADKKPQDYLKTIDLNNCEDMVAPFPVSNRVYVIKVAISNRGKIRDYFFDCEDQRMMDEWVSSLAKVCGFTAVDAEEEQDTYSEITSSPLSDVSPPPLPSVPRPQSNTSPPPLLVNRPKLRPPLPPPKMSSPTHSTDETTALYEDPNLVSFPSNYSVATDGFSDGEIQEDLYDGRITDRDLYTLNKKPPPVWRPTDNSAPPPLPNRQKRFTKTLEKGNSATINGMTFSFPSDSPPPLPGRPSSRGESSNLKNGKKKKSGSFSLKKSLKIPRIKKSKPLPPVNEKNTRAKTPPPQPSAFQQQKLELRKPDKTNGPGITRARSWGEDIDDLEPYEEISYHGEGEEDSSSFDQRMYNSSSEESDDGYVDCDPATADTPQDYLDFQTASQRASQYMEENSSNFHSSAESNDRPLPLPPRETPPKQPTRSSRPFGSHDPPSQAPPRIPSRNVESFSAQDEEESAPPVPRRHPNASDRNKRTTAPLAVPERTRTSSPNNRLPLPPRKSPSPSPRNAWSPPPQDNEDEAPPVPVRGAGSLRPALNRPQSDVRTDRAAETNPPYPARGVSCPTGGQRLPQPPPKTSPGHSYREESSVTSEEEEDDSIFEDVTFGRPSPQEAKPPPKPHNRQGFSSGRVSSNESITSDSRPPAARPKLKPPIPAVTVKPKPTRNDITQKPRIEVTQKPNPPSVNTRTKVSLSPPFVNPKPKATTPPPPIAHKPTLGPPTSQKPPLSKSPAVSKKTVPSLPESRKKLPGPPFPKSSDMRKKQPEPPLTNGAETRKTNFYSPDTRKRLPDPPSSHNPERRENLPDPPFSNGPEPRKKLPVPNGPSTSRKPPPTAPKVKPVMKHLNNDLAACLQNNNPSVKGAPFRNNSSSTEEPRNVLGNSGTKRPMVPMVPTKPKPGVPSRR